MQAISAANPATPVAVNLDLAGVTTTPATSISATTNVQVNLFSSNGNAMAQGVTVSSGTVIVEASVAPVGWTVNGGNVVVEGSANAGDFTVNSGTVTFSNGSVITGHSPAIVVNFGQVILQGATVQTATDAPTILVTAGSLVARGSTIEESTAYDDAVIEITGGTADLGTTADPGGNTIDVNGAGQFLEDPSLIPVPDVGNTLEQDGTPLTANYLSLATITSSSPTAVAGQPVTFTATVCAANPDDGTPGGTITFMDGTTELGTADLNAAGVATFTTSSLAPGTHTISASYGGDASFATSSAAMSQQENSTPQSTFTVTSLDDSGVGTLRWAIAQADMQSIAVTISFAIDTSVPQTIQLESALPDLTGDITIAGPGSDRLAVRGLNDENIVFSIFSVDSGATVSISGLTITNGLSYCGGGIDSVDATSLTVSNCTITGNSASSSDYELGGGGIFCETSTGGVATISGNTISGNSALWGGGIDCNYVSGQVTISGNAVSGNSGMGGCGIDCDNQSGVVTISGNSISDNFASTLGYGGGISCESSGEMTISDNTIANNTLNTTGVVTGCAGAGIGSWISGGVLTISGNTITGNACLAGPRLLISEDGGGIYCNPSGATVVISENTITGNFASYAGGAVYSSNATGTVQLVSNTIDSNNALYGGGIYADNGPIAVEDSIVAGNTSWGNPNSAVADVATYSSGSFTSLGYNLIGVASGAPVWNSTDLQGTLSQPLDPRLGPLVDNGGPVWTQGAPVRQPGHRCG